MAGPRLDALVTTSSATSSLTYVLFRDGHAVLADFGISLLRAMSTRTPIDADAGTRDLRNRINGCMRCSMNGREVAMRQPEMTAMAAYTSNRSETSTRPWA